MLFFIGAVVTWTVQDILVVKVDVMVDFVRNSLEMWAWEGADFGVTPRKFTKPARTMRFQGPCVGRCENRDSIHIVGSAKNGNERSGLFVGKFPVVSTFGADAKKVGLQHV